jgi:hypothetical protein
MKTPRVLLASLTMSAIATSALAQIPFTATCTNAALGAGVIGQKIVGQQTVFVRRLATIKDPAMDDFGTTAPGDALELFCVSAGQNDQLGMMAGCLSHEACPWR